MVCVANECVGACVGVREECERAVPNECAFADILAHVCGESQCKINRWSEAHRSVMVNLALALFDIDGPTDDR